MNSVANFHTMRVEVFFVKYEIVHVIVFIGLVATRWCLMSQSHPSTASMMIIGLVSTIHGWYLMRARLACDLSILAFGAVCTAAGTANAQQVVVVEPEPVGDNMRARAGVESFGRGPVPERRRHRGGRRQHSPGDPVQQPLRPLRPGPLRVHRRRLRRDPASATGLSDSFDAVADFTFDRVFVGAGAGGAYFGYGDSAAPEVLVRFGFYPLVTRNRWGMVGAHLPGRAGLVIGADLRMIYVPDSKDTFLEPTLLIGWEWF